MKVFDEYILKKATNMWQIQNVAKYGKKLPNIANVAKFTHFSILGIRFAKGKKGELLQCFWGVTCFPCCHPFTLEACMPGS